MTQPKNSNEQPNGSDLRSEEFQEILGRPPRWTVRWGITVILVVVAMLILGSWLFKYPDVVHSQIVVTTENPPAPIVARSSGKIDHLLVNDKQKVQKGQALAVIENTGNYRDILKLEHLIQNFRNRIQKGMPDIEGMNVPMDLGEVQPQYALFLKRLEEYRHFRELNYHQRKIESLKEELERAKHHQRRLSNQRAIVEDEYELARRQFQRDSMLYEREVIPEAEYEKSETRLLKQRYTLEQVEVSLSDARIRISRIRQDILEQELQYKRERNQLESSLMEGHDNLKASIEQWKRNYYLTSPIDGKVTFTRYWSENQYVEQGKRVMTVVPEREGEMIGKMTLPFQGAGKVKVGQQANIEFANYPPLEYGMVKGVVRSISLVPEDQVYAVEVELPGGLTTFYGEKLEFSQQMKGKAEVITEDTRLLERIVRPLKYVVNKNLKR